MPVVYKITREDGLEYIGVTTNIRSRLSSHKKSLRFSKFGIKEYSILYESDEYEECLKQETYYIKVFNTYKSGLNVTKDGKGLNGEECKFNTLGYVFSEDSRKKMSISRKKFFANTTRRWKRTYTTEERELMSTNAKGKITGPVKLTKKDTIILKDRYAALPIIPIEYIIDHVKISQIPLVTSGVFKFEELKSKLNFVFSSKVLLSYNRAFSEVYCKDYIEKYNLCIATICNIINNRSWNGEVYTK